MTTIYITHHSSIQLPIKLYYTFEDVFHIVISYSIMYNMFVNAFIDAFVNASSYKLKHPHTDV